MPELDFSPLGDLYNTYRHARDRAQSEQALQQFAQNGGQFDPATRQLIAANPQLGLSLAQMAIANKRDERDFAARRGDVGFQHGITERTTKLAEQSAAEAAKGFDYREVEINGEKVFIKTDKSTGKSERIDISGVPQNPTNPFAFGKQNENQSKDSGYADRMFRAENVLRDPSVEAAAVDLKQNMLGKAPGFVSNYLTGPEFQKFDQAKRDFVNAVLRRESGAAISQSEFDNANKQYFPQPGDAPERIAEKKRNRQDAIAGVAGGGGPTYRPPYSFGPNGELVSSGAPPRGQALQPGQPAKADPNAWKTKEAITAARSNPQAALTEAQQAIQRGADPRAVAQRLQQVGIDSSPLFQNSGFAGPGQRQ